ncbi:hypothetical protein SNE40_003316 [Patella caerulea]|uniref:EGF-like domain-containing protein n=1 Tax=Patella caerulea TaxID=87958 RepID=A0AAN8KAY7_PATCE
MEEVKGVFIFLLMTLVSASSIKIGFYELSRFSVMTYNQLITKTSLYNVKSKIHCVIFCSQQNNFISPSEIRPIYDPTILTNACGFYQGKCYYIQNVSSCLKERSTDLTTCQCKPYFYGQFCQRIISSCKDVSESKVNPVNGVYSVIIDNGNIIQLFCDFQPNRIISFISKYSFLNLTNADLNFFSNKTKVVMRQEWISEQRDAILGQLSMYPDYQDLKISINAPVDYNPTTNGILGDYLYVGFLKNSLISSGTTNGYTTNGNQYTFPNCNSDGNSYYAFYPNVEDNQPTDRRNYSDRVDMFAWSKNTQTVELNQQLPDEFFYITEIHFGGCGGHTVSTEWSSIRAASIGLITQTI